MPNKDLTVRTAGENLWLGRRSKSLTQAGAAKLFKVSARHYGKAELDKVTLPPWDSPGRPTPGDLCALARRRYGRGLAGTAKLLRCSKVTLLKREGRDDPELVRFWEKRGFTFR